MSNKIMYIAIAIAIGAGLVLLIMDWQNKSNLPTTLPDSDKDVACTEEAKMCPDGSYVGRTGPNCEFVCPTGSPLSVDQEEHIASKANLITLDNPAPLAVLTSPLQISGDARGYWYFEASFPVTLLNSAGEVVAEGVATAQDDWMTEEFVPFTASLTFTNPYQAGDPETEKVGKLVLKKDNPSDMPEKDDALEIPIRFAQ